MGKKPPCPIFVDDFDMDTAAWTPEQLGIYLRLLFYQWTNKMLPIEKAALARISRCSQHRFDRAWEEVLKQKFELNIFPKTDELNEFDSPKNYSKTMVNRKMEEVRKNRDEWIKHQTLSGYKGAGARWNKPLKAHGNPNGETMATNSNPIHIKIESSYEDSNGIPDWISKKTFQEYQAMRKNKIKPKSLPRFFTALKKICDETGTPPEDILNQSIVNGWQGIFPLKVNTAKTKHAGIKAWLQEKEIINAEK